MRERHPIPLIIYDGPENSGKTTTKRVVNELINHQSISFERWTGTAFAYGKLYNREPDLAGLSEMDKDIDHNFNVLLVYLFGYPGELKERINTDPNFDTKYDLSIRNYNELIFSFDIWFQNCMIRNKMRFNSSQTEPEDRAVKIRDKLVELRWISQKTV